MRRKSPPPRVAHVMRAFVFKWTKCIGCGDEVCLERMWRYETSEGTWWRGHFVYVCSICAHSKEGVLDVYDVRRTSGSPPSDE